MEFWEEWSGLCKQRDCGNRSGRQACMHIGMQAGILSLVPLALVDKVIESSFVDDHLDSSEQCIHV